MTLSAAAATASALSRVIPGGGRHSLRMVERNLMVFRHGGWLVILSGFFESLLYLVGIGFGVGALVGNVTQGGVTTRYAVFVAPALMASSAMNGAVNETTFNMFYKLRYAKLYDAVLSTPLGIVDIALGEVLWALMRGLSYVIGFIVVMAALGLVVSPWAVFAVPAALLISVAFAGAGVATTSFMKTWQDFAAVQLVVLPLFLFSATFYPLTSYSPPFRVIVELTPLYHGVHLLRGLTTGAVGPDMLLDVVYLLALGVAGILIASRRLERQLLR
ncbi:MAG TPA: ABC transporter permease [Candidatus Dormibacteraeota bacterium]|jgi:lipooligosaccharide transport system permease protein|nr:ABC transporter permease [Candidatus Dormibacteraeota bacterium]